MTDLTPPSEPPPTPPGLTVAEAIATLRERRDAATRRRDSAEHRHESHRWSGRAVAYSDAVDMLEQVGPTLVPCPHETGAQTLYRSVEGLREVMRSPTEVHRRSCVLIGGEWWQVTTALPQRGPTQHDLINDLHTALHGEPSPARNATPKQVWEELLSEVTEAVTPPEPEPEPAIEVGDIVRVGPGPANPYPDFGRVVRPGAGNHLVNLLGRTGHVRWQSSNCTRVDDPCAGWTTKVDGPHTGGDPRPWYWTIGPVYYRTTDRGRANTEADAKARATEALDRARLDLLRAREENAR